MLRKVNLNSLAVDIAHAEGGRVNLSIAQIKEVLRCLSIQMVLDDGVCEALKALGRRRINAVCTKYMRMQNEKN